MHPFSPLLQNEKEQDSSNDDPSFPLRIKLNNTDLTLNVNKSVTISTLKQWILDQHRSNVASNVSENMYLRLIVRGRLMAPDSSTLEQFHVSSSDVVHAVLAKEGRGAQARMLRRLNTNTTNGRNTARNAVASNSSDSLQRLWRRIGIDASGIVVSREDNGDDSEESEEDVESGEGGRRERRGFDRLRSTGMTRDEVNIIRSYFARSVDRYIERRRILLRASSQLRNSLGEGRGRLDTGDSSNSLLESGSGENEGGESGVEVGAGNNRDENGHAASGSSGDGSANTPVEGEEILLDHLRMEDEWMSTQGPYSEFRMNLNTNNPLLLAAISGTNPTNPTLSNILSGTNRNRRGLFSRRSNNNNNGDSEEDEDDLMFGSLGPNPMILPNNSFRAPYMGPLPSAGTDKDFLWGFILGFFVGFIMLFWVWMPTVPHKQKIGIISGVICQLGLSLLRKSGEEDVAI